MNKITTEHTIHFTNRRRSKKIEAGPMVARLPETKIPRIAKMMALAIRFEHLIRSGQVKDQAELARVGHVTRARLTQIMDLNLLAPDIQDEILSSSANDCRHMLERSVRQLVKNSNWGQQRIEWFRLRFQS